jgi:hypothetical protein
MEKSQNHYERTDLFELLCDSFVMTTETTSFSQRHREMVNANPLCYQSDKLRYDNYCDDAEHIPYGKSFPTYQWLFSTKKATKPRISMCSTDTHVCQGGVLDIFNKECVVLNDKSQWKYYDQHSRNLHIPNGNFSMLNALAILHSSMKKYLDNSKWDWNDFIAIALNEINQNTNIKGIDNETIDLHQVYSFINSFRGKQTDL